MENRKRLSAGRWLAVHFYHLRGTAHRYWGTRLMSTEEHLRAVEDFTRALALDPTFVQALYDRGLLYWRELSQADRADRDLSRVMELEPGRVETWFNRALARQLQGDTTGAIADFEVYLRRGEDPMWREISQRQLNILRSLAAAEEEAGQ